MNIDYLYTFLSLANTSSITKLSEAKNTSAAGISYQIRQLEDELGVRLFERKNNGSFLTNEGRNFKIYAERIIDTYEDAIRELKGDHILHVGINATFMPRFFGELIEGFKKEFPHLMVELIPFNTAREARNLLRDSKIDVLFGYSSFLNEPNYVRVFLDDYLLITAKGRYNRPEVTLRDLMNEEIYLSNFELLNTEYFMNEAASSGFRMKYSADNKLSIISYLIENENAVTICPSLYSSVFDESFDRIPIRRATTSLGVYYHEEDNKTKAFLSFCKDYFHKRTTVQDIK